VKADREVIHRGLREDVCMALQMNLFPPDTLDRSPPTKQVADLNPPPVARVKIFLDRRKRKGFDKGEKK